MQIEFKPSYKQHLAWQLLEDKSNKIKQVLVGGGAGGGKSVFGAAWKIYRRLTYPNSRGLVAREQMVDITESVLVTYRKMLTQFGLVKDRDYRYNANDHEFTFTNGSTEKFAQMPYEPSDPDYEYLGSKEYTDIWLEEASELTEKALEVATTRCRWMLSEYGLIPKVLITCNPSQGWLYKEFYVPDKEGTLEYYRAFVRALVYDNPDPEFVRIYLDSLNQIKDPATRARLRDGDWEYATDDRTLYYHDKLIKAFKNRNKKLEGKACLTVDTSRFGKDETVLYRYSGFIAKQRYIVTHNRNSEIKPTQQVINKVLSLEEEYDIERHNVVVDEMGAGGAGVVDGLPGCVNFVASEKPIQIKAEPKAKDKSLTTHKPNYENRKAQCAYLLADKLNDEEFAIEEEDGTMQNDIIQQALAHKKKALDNGKKLGITPKEKIVEQLKRSPNEWDNFIMRMLLEIKPKTNYEKLQTFNVTVDLNSILKLSDNMMEIREFGAF